MSVVRKKFIGPIQFILSQTTSCICRFCCIEHLYGRFPLSCIYPLNFFRTIDTTDTKDTTIWKPGFRGHRKLEPRLDGLFMGRLRAVPLRSVTSKLGRTGESEFTRARKARVRSEQKPRGSWERRRERREGLHSQPQLGEIVTERLLISHPKTKIRKRDSG